MDINGDGNLALVDLSPPAAGYNERAADSGWSGYRYFHSLPIRDWSDPNLRFVDLTGDGVADVLITEDDAFTWHACLPREGFGPGVRVAVPSEEERAAGDFCRRDPIYLPGRHVRRRAFRSAADSQQRSLLLAEPRLWPVRRQSHHGQFAMVRRAGPVRPGP